MRLKRFSGGHLTAPLAGSAAVGSKVPTAVAEIGTQILDVPARPKGKFLPETPARYMYRAFVALFGLIARRARTT
jgi:hypothetical protein